MFGSTVATNALAQRRLATVGLLATAGFRDLLDIRRLWRPRLFGHDWDRPPALVPRELRLEARGRLAPDGDEVEPLDEGSRRGGRRLPRGGVEAVAIAFLHAYANDAHERRAGDADRRGPARASACCCHPTSTRSARSTSARRPP